MPTAAVPGMPPGLHTETHHTENSQPMDTSFKGAAERLTDADILAACAAEGVPYLNLKAVINTETSGSGFDREGRPSILFEPHVFWRNLPPSQQTVASDLGIAYPKWGMRPYPPDSYPHLVQACGINETAALKSASWGLGQVLGENFQTLGYTSVQDMVADALQSEALQLQQMIAFIKGNGLLQRLAAGDWAAFARGYNGAGYAQNHYDTKLAGYVSSHQTLLAAAPPPPAPETAGESEADKLMEQYNPGTAATGAGSNG
jgi:hypothetical protein